MINRKYTPIQIIGTQRSGSNLLRLMLNELQEVVAPHPPHILNILMPLVSQYPDLSIEKNFKVLIEDACQLIEKNPVSWEHVKLDRDRVFSLCKTRTLMEVFKSLYEMMAEANGAKYWCCKSMANVKYVDQIEQHGIKPFYIHLVRDGRDVAASFKKVAVGEKHIYSLAKTWQKGQELSLEAIQLVGKERARTIRYEDLIQEPERIMKELCNFLGLTYNSKMFDFYVSEESKHTAESGFMWVNLTKPIMKNNIEKYKKSLSSDEIEIFESVAGSALKKFGYDLETTPNTVKLDNDIIEQFEIENERLKKEIKLKDHLKTDIKNRSKQVAFIDSIKKRVVSKESESI